MKKIFIYFSLLSLVLILNSCGSTPTKIEDFNLTIDLPSGWRLEKGTVKMPNPYFYLYKNNRRSIEIEVSEPSVDNLDMLLKASAEAQFEVLSKESFSNGFGVTLQKKGKKKKDFAYYIRKDNKQYRFQTGAYFKNEFLDEVIKVIKTVK